MARVQCHKCKTVTDTAKNSIGFREECGTCGEDLHVCLNCRFYDPSSYNECREPSAERIKVKDRSNLCDYFEPQDESAQDSEKKKKEDLLAQAEALFKNSGKN